MKKWFTNPKVRLAARAVFVGVIAAGNAWLNEDFATGAVQGAVLAGLLAGFEIITPANALVGLFKTEVK